MHLIAPLSVGIRGARNGTVFAYERGTDTPAPTWADASGKLRRHGALRLDMWGTMSLYVDRLVDIIVYDSSMLLIRRWTDGRSAGAVVVESPAFTGVDYETGVSAVGERTTLIEALGRWKDSAGTVDWNVLFSGASAPVSDVIGNSAGVFFDARAFGAAGDGTGDDSGPIQAAIDSALAAGGGTVFLRAGTYNVSIGLFLHESVSITGEGYGTTTIRLTGQRGPLLAMIGAGDNTTPSHSVSKIGFSSNVSTADSLLFAVSGNVVIESCLFDGSFATGSLVSVSEPYGFRVHGCEFIVASIGSSGVRVPSEALLPVRVVHVSNCMFRVLGNRPSAGDDRFGIVDGTGLKVDGCLFDFSGVGTGEAICLLLDGDVAGVLDGCEMIPSATAESTLIATTSMSSTEERLFEDCSVSNHSVAAARLYSIAEGSSGEFPHARLKTVTARVLNGTTTVATAANANLTHIFSDNSQHGVYSLRSTSAAAGAGNSSLLINVIGSVATYSANIELGRVVTVLYTVGVADDYLTNLFRDSVFPDFAMGSSAVVIGFNMISMRAIVNESAASDVSKLMCLTSGSTSGGTMLSGY